MIEQDRAVAIPGVQPRLKRGLVWWIQRDGPKSGVDTDGFIGGASTKTVCAPCFSQVTFTVRPMARVRCTAPAGTTRLCHSVSVVCPPCSNSIRSSPRHHEKQLVGIRVVMPAILSLENRQPQALFVNIQEHLIFVELGDGGLLGAKVDDGHRRIMRSLGRILLGRGELRFHGQEAGSRWHVPGRKPVRKTRRGQVGRTRWNLPCMVNR